MPPRDPTYRPKFHPLINRMQRRQAIIGLQNTPGSGCILSPRSKLDPSNGSKSILRWAQRLVHQFGY